MCIELRGLGHNEQPIRVSWTRRRPVKRLTVIKDAVANARVTRLNMFAEISQVKRNPSPQRQGSIVASPVPVHRVHTKCTKRAADCCSPLPCDTRVHPNLVWEDRPVRLKLRL
eukprot:scaffold1850_cov170-Amphora_coffeaeformis.AAC.9